MIVILHSPVVTPSLVVSSFLGGLVVFILMSNKTHNVLGSVLVEIVVWLSWGCNKI